MPFSSEEGEDEDEENARKGRVDEEAISATPVSLRIGAGWMGENAWGAPASEFVCNTRDAAQKQLARVRTMQKYAWLHSESKSCLLGTRPRSNK